MHQSVMPKAVSAKDRFRIFCPVRVFRKAATADSGPSMDIEGLISSNRKDLQAERVLQKGLDFGYFLSHRGTFNNEHLPGHKNVLGIPTGVQQFAKGDKLPNGQLAPRDCTWATGRLLNDPDGIHTYQKAQALQEQGRSLGFSIEGRILRRAGPDGSIIAKAEVRHVAICHEPVNPDAQMDKLVRSLRAAQAQTARRAGKSLLRVTPETGDGPDSPLVREDKSRRISNLAGPPTGRRKKKAKQRNPGASMAAKKSHQPPNIVQSVLAAFPCVGVEYAVLLAAQLDRQPSRTTA